MNAKAWFDGGYRSRKFAFAAGIATMIFLSGVLTSTLLKGMGPYLETVVDGLLTTLGLYLGGNVGTKFFAGRVKESPEPAAPEPESAPVEQAQK